MPHYVLHSIYLFIRPTLVLTVCPASYLAPRPTPHPLHPPARPPWHRYVVGDTRFTRYSKSNPRKMVKLWAEKEMRNLVRLRAAGIAAPAPTQLRMHVLAMEFLGADGVAAPRLKDAGLPLARLRSAYTGARAGRRGRGRRRGKRGEGVCRRRGAERLSGSGGRLATWRPLAPPPASALPAPTPWPCPSWHRDGAHHAPALPRGSPGAR